MFPACSGIQGQVEDPGSLSGGRRKFQPEDDTTSYGVLWDHVWKAPFLNRLNTDIEYTWTDNREDEISLRLSAEKSLLADVKITGTAQHGITKDNTIGKSSALRLRSYQADRYQEESDQEDRFPKHR